MATKKKGFFSRMIEGPERSDTYARSTLPGNRWELGWDLIKNSFGKMFKLNWLIILFFIPVFLLIFVRSVLIDYYAVTLPFSQNLGLGYPAISTTAGLTESIQIEVNKSILLFLPIVAIIASVGLSGGLYVMRNMIWAEGVFVGSDFWTGVKKNFKEVCISTLIYCAVLLSCILSISYANYLRAIGDGSWLLVATVIISYVVLGFLTIVYLYTLTLSVTYKLKYTHLIRNSFILAFGLLPTNLFFALFALIIVIMLAFGGQLLMMLAIMLFILFGMSGAVLVWTNYSHWVFDKFINDKVPGAVKNRGIYSKTPEEEEAEFSFERSTLGKRPIKPITDDEIEIVELPETFSRADLIRLEESKVAMRKDSDEYVNQKLVEMQNENTNDGETAESTNKSDQSTESESAE